ncbi:hypothetical protein H1R20_g10547, partial [Candolleomyces eurysporus]
MRGETEGLPNVFKLPVLEFELPNGSQCTITNPLAFYDFEGDIPDGFQNMVWSTSLVPEEAESFFKIWPRTYRWPTSSPNAPNEDYERINTLMRGDKAQRGSVRQLRDQVGRLFTYPTPGETALVYEHRLMDIAIGSIEAPHNTVHLLLGGLGYMANADYAGFDPIFYIHHCNIDRILAFWEYTYNEFWVGEGYYHKDGGENVIRFTQSGGPSGSGAVEVDQSSPLQPYRSTKGEYWIPKQARFLNASSSFEQDLVAKVGQEVKRVRLTDPLPTTDEEVHICRAVLQASFPLAQPREGKLELGDAKNETRGGANSKVVPNYRHFYVFVELVGHAFGGSYSLELVHEGQVIASFAIFSRGDQTQCAACRVQREAGGLVKGVVHIPDDVITSIIDSRSDELSRLPDQGKLPEVARAVRESVHVRLVNPAGHLLADAVGHSRGSDSGSGEGAGIPLDDAIIPKIELQSCRAVRKEWPVELEDEPGEAALSFFGHVEFGDLLTSDHQWRKA